MSLLATLALPVLLSSPGLTSTGDTPEWGGFRGTNGRGLAAAGKAPAALSEDHIAWRVEIPGGYSSPVVSGPHLFLTATEGTKLFTLCLERDTGEVVWEREMEFDGKRVGANSAAAPTPVTDGKAVYVVFQSFGIVAYDVDGEELWTQEIGPFNIPHGMASSPIVHDDLLILLVDQDTGAFLAAYDKQTGDERWRVERVGVTHSYSTPAIWEPEEGPPQVIVSGSFEVAGYSLSDGEKIWWVKGSAWQTKSVPVIVDDICYVNAYMVPSNEIGIPRVNMSFEDALAEKDADSDGKLSRSEWEDPTLHMAWFIFDLDGDDMLDKRDYEYLEASATSPGGLFAIRLGGKGDVTESHMIWRFDDRRGLPDCPSPLVVGETMFLVKEPGLLSTVDCTSGETAKRERVGESDQYFASPVGWGDQVVLASLGGQLLMVSAQPEWEELAAVDLGEQLWATPAIAGDQMFVRTMDALYCFEAVED